MGGIETSKKIFVHSVIPSFKPGSSFHKEEGRLGVIKQHVGLRAAFSLHGTDPDAKLYPPIQIQWQPSTLESSATHKQSLATIVKHRDLRPNLMASMGHLRSNQPNGSPIRLIMFLWTRRTLRRGSGSSSGFKKSRVRFLNDRTISAAPP